MHRLTRTLSLFALVSTLGICQEPSGPPKGPRNAGETITAKDLARHLKIVAADAFGGRCTGTAGEKKVAAYIAEHFEACGLEPLGDKSEDGERSWLQSYPITLRQPTEDSGLVDDQDKRLHERGGWLMSRTLSRGRSKLGIKGPLRFLDRGRDLEDESLGGTIPVCIVDQDLSLDGKVNVMGAMGPGFKEMTRLRAIAKTLKAAGASGGVILCKQLSMPFLAMSGMGCVSRDRPAVSLGHEGRTRDPMAAMFSPSIPLLFLGGEDSERILEALGLDTEATWSLTDTDRKKTTETRYQLVCDPELEKTHAVNVAAVLRGTDPKLSKEALIISAHLDHEGVAPDGTVFNGADDNGSGTVSLLELAEAFAALAKDQRPKRSVIFLAVSGEEKGLWGSEWYASHSTWPLKKIIANINIDMVGRSTKKVPETAIAVTPTYRHKAYSTLAREAFRLGRQFDLEMRSADRFYRRSDHYNFAKRGIPIVFFSDDEHPDYHMPSDTPDKIEYDKMQRLVRLVFQLAYNTANREPKPETLGRHSDWEGEPKGR